VQIDLRSMWMQPLAKESRFAGNVSRTKCERINE